MNIKEVLAKVTAEETLTEAEKEFLVEYNEPDIDGAVNARSKKERLKSDKKLSERDTLIAEMKEELELANEGGSELEKMKRDMEKQAVKLAKLTSELETETTAHGSTKRNNALGRIDIPWMNGISNKYKDTVLAEAFDGIDTDDLSDDTMTSSVITKLVEENANFIDSGAKGGTGTKVTENGKKLSGSKTVWTRAKIAEAAKDGTITEHSAEIQAQANAGLITE